jgi:iron-sulfur cluster assembly protein
MAVNEVQTNRIDPVEADQVITVTPAALSVIHNLLEQRNIPGYALRVFVSGGGCSGLQYGMAFEQTPREFDCVVEQDDVKLVIDPTSMMYLQGANIDYVDSLMGGGFRIDNPNAVSSCGCGHSFRTGSDAEADASGGCGCGSGGSCSH